MLMAFENPVNTTEILSNFIDKAQYYRRSQQIIDQYYLQPLKCGSNGSTLTSRNFTKDHLRNGHIEREIHGAMHASRVSIYVEILHCIMKEQFPEYTNNTMLALENILKLNEPAIMVLARYAALCHDAARQGEGTDKWEKESSEVTLRLFEKNDTNPLIANVFSLLVEHKDNQNYHSSNQNKFDKACATLGYPESVIIQFHYLRRLISLADCFDIIRCTSNFDFSYIKRQLCDIPGFDELTHGPVFLEFAQQVYVLLKDQQDLYFSADAPGAYISAESSKQRHFSLAQKVRFEHAPNVLSATVSYMQRYPYYAKYLVNETLDVLAETELSSLDAIISPYLHGTSSSALALLAQTQFKLQSPIDMLAQNLRAPITGELTGGGFASVGARCNPCFGRLNGEVNTNEYTLEKIITYSQPGLLPNLGSTLIELRQQLQSENENPLYAHINLILIFAARYRQLGGNLRIIPELQALSSTLEAIKGIFYLYLIIDHHLEPLATLDSLDRSLLGNALYAHCKAPMLIKKIKESQLNLKEIYELPTEQRLQDVLAFLELPKISTDDMYACGDSDDDMGYFGSTPLEQTQAFQIRTSPIKTTKNPTNLGFLKFVFAGEEISHFSTGDMMRNLVTQKRAIWNFKSSIVTNKILQHINQIDERIQTCKRMLDNPEDMIHFHPSEQAFIDSPFPLILIYDQELKMEIIDFKTQEYRAKNHLTLGHDICTVATDTVAHQQQLRDYFSMKQLTINVVLFEDLYRLRNRLVNNISVTKSTAIAQNMVRSSYNPKLFLSITESTEGQFLDRSCALHNYDQLEKDHNLIL